MATKRTVERKTIKLRWPGVELAGGDQKHVTMLKLMHAASTGINSVQCGTIDRPSLQ